MREVRTIPPLSPLAHELEKRIMAKSKKEPAVLEEAPKEEGGSRQARWKTFLEIARAQNPVKFEIKEENGEFDTIPDSFN